MRVPTFHAGRKTVLAFDHKNPDVAAISNDKGETYEWMRLVATERAVRFAEAFTDYYYQYVKRDGNSEVITFRDERQAQSVVYGTTYCSPYDTIEHVSWSPENTRVIEQAFAAIVDGRQYYYVFTSQPDRLGHLDRSLRLYCGEKGELSEITEFDTEQTAGSTGYLVVTNDMTFTVNKPPYKRLIPGSDETTDANSKPSKDVSTWKLDDENHGVLTDVWSKRHKLFRHVVGRLESVVLL